MMARSGSGDLPPGIAALVDGGVAVQQVVSRDQCAAHSASHTPRHTPRHAACRRRRRMPGAMSSPRPFVRRTSSPPTRSCASA